MMLDTLISTCLDSFSPKCSLIKELTPQSEFILTTNVANDATLLGVAQGKIRDSKEDPWRVAYFAFYSLPDGSKRKLEVNEDLYQALHLVFSTILDIHSI